VNTVNGAHRHGPGVASRLLAGTGSIARAGRHLGMSRFNWADGGFNSTSAPA
jgi:molybdenum-dependent DNA-binding transcriptional regulator ModE